MYCKNCGREQKIGQKFCPICGTPFVVVNNENQEKIKENQSKPIEVFEDEKPENLMDDIKALEVKDIKGEGEADIAFETDVNKKLLPSPNEDNTSEGIREEMKTNVGVEKNKEEKNAMVKKIVFGIIAVCIFFGGKAACEGSDISSLSNSSEYDVSTTSSKSSSNSQEEEILLEMARIRDEIKSVLPQIEILYNAHQRHMAQGLPYYSSPAWGKWQDCNNRIDNLWNKYINLARKLDDNDDIIKEAQESRRSMDRTIMNMFGPHY